MEPTQLTPILSVATVGTKGQIVIPLEIRQKLGVNPGDKVVLIVKHEGMAALCPMESMREWLQTLNLRMDTLDSETNKTTNMEKETP